MGMSIFSMFRAFFFASSFPFGDRWSICGRGGESERLMEGMKASGNGIVSPA